MKHEQETVVSRNYPFSSIIYENDFDTIKVPVEFSTIELNQIRTYLITLEHEFSIETYRKLKVFTEYIFTPIFSFLPCRENIWEWAKTVGNPKFVHWLHTTFPKEAEIFDPLNKAITENDIAKILQLYNTSDEKMSRYGFTFAILNGSMDSLDWIYSCKRSIFTDKTVLIAIESRDLNVIKWFVNHGIRNKREEVKYAVKHGIENVVTFFCSIASKHRKNKILKYIREECNVVV